jgi:hypothetical protein
MDGSGRLCHQPEIQIHRSATHPEFGVSKAGFPALKRRANIADTLES